MKKTALALGVFAAFLVAVALTVGRLARDREPPAVGPALAASGPPAGPEGYRGFLYGRVTTVTGAAYEGRLRWGRGQEAFWSDTFNGVKSGNPWAADVPPARLPREKRPLEVFGIRVLERERLADLGRPFVTRFGDIAHVEASGSDVRVTLKSGTTFDLDRFEAGDFDDGVRVWDGARGVVDLDSREIRAIELLPTPALGDVPGRLRGTVRTRQGDFTGFVRWDREECVGTDELVGTSFDTIGSIVRREGEGVLVSLLDGREIELSGDRKVGPGNRGIDVDDPRYGRVSISWDAFERVDFTPGGSGPGYDEFPPGRPLAGSVTTRGNDVFTGRLVYDLDESETSETLDAPAGGVDYTIPFGRIVSIVPPLARVVLQGGEELQLEHAGDLGEKNAGLLIFVDGRERPEYVPWVDVERIDFDGLGTTPLSGMGSILR